MKIRLVRLTLAIGLLTAGISQVQAASIDYGALGNFVQTPSGMLSAVGNAVRLGTFTPGFDFAANSGNFATTNGAFTQFDITSIGTGGFGNGQFFDSTANLSGISGQRLYIWAFNTNTPSTASAWAIVSNNIPDWTGPADGANSTSIDTSDAGVFVPSGAWGRIVTSTSPAGFDVQMVPEPSTYALLGLGLGGLAFGVVQQRRRWQAVGA